LLFWRPAPADAVSGDAVECPMDKHDKNHKPKNGKSPAKKGKAVKGAPAAAAPAASTVQDLRRPK
jgi:hypothetical protein